MRSRFFMNKGYEGASMSDLAAATGIKKASLYAHYSGKEEIFSAVFTGVVEEYRETFSGGVQPVAAKRMAADPYGAPAAARDAHFLPDYDGPDEGLNPRPAENPGQAGGSPAAKPGWRLPEPPAPRTGSLTRDPATLGYCTHKIYGRGKIIAEISPGKFRVNFSGFGPKVILGDYLQMEQP